VSLEIVLIHLSDYLDFCIANYYFNLHERRDLFPRQFLADRTYALALILSFACVFWRLSSSVTLCIVAKRCVLEQTLLLTAHRKSYEKSIGTDMTFTFI